MGNGIEMVEERSDRYYSASAEPELVEIAPVRVVTIDGQGEPGGPEHLQAIEGLFAVVAELGEVGSDHGIPAPSPLEGLWWVDGERPALEVPREEWRWRLLLRVPESVDEDSVARARKRADAPGVDRVGLDELAEGLCVQALHVGPYEDEPQTLAAMEAEMRRHGLVMNGRHHEIYLTDLSGPAEEARTILRHPVRRRSAVSDQVGA
jgi:hypothetical protein